ncbi:hypothetical protein, partial [Kitasatospora sp. MBT63]|uniref:hypothetical protein n=1 Tax=Kitasatospora sp. MBT63 TaxID=1444768 RepID=UPI0018F5F84C
PAGATGIKDARATTTRTLDLAGRPVASSSVFADTTLPAPAASTGVYDGLGHLGQTTENDITTIPVYGYGGVQTGAQMRPASE